MLCRLFDQGMHCLSDVRVRMDSNIIRGHFTSDFIFIKGDEQGDFPSGRIVHQFHQRAAVCFFHLPQTFHRRSCFHLLQYINFFSHTKLVQKQDRIFRMFQYVR